MKQNCFPVEEKFETWRLCTGWLRECHKRINIQHYSAPHLLSQERKSPFMSISGMKEDFRKEEGAFTFKIAAPFTTRPHLPVPIESVGLTDRSVLSWTQSTTTGENTRAAKVHAWITHINLRESLLPFQSTRKLLASMGPWRRFFVG